MSSLNNELEKKYGQVIYIPNAIWAENTLEAIYRESTYRREGYRQMQSAYMKELLVTVHRNLTGGCENPLCLKIKSCIMENLFLNNTQIAEKFGYHPYYINEVFRNSEGITLHQYILRQRLAKSYELVTTTSMSFETIAQMCGFSSQAHFSSMFKKMYGSSPINFRHQI